jgi:spermidine synthase
MTAPGLPPIDGTWYCDLWDPNLKILHRIRTTLFDGASAYQAVEVADTVAFGRMLVIDGLPQAAEKDEMVYARALAWPALLGVPGPKRVLITGGGDGHVLREVLRFPSVTAAVVCDIDPLVTRVTQQHMPFLWDGAHRDPRAEVRHADAWEYLGAAGPGSFEVVISDITDPSGEASASHHLYSLEYFERIKRCLARGGVCVAQAQELSVREWQHHARLRALVAKVFGTVRSAHVYMPSFGYPEGLLFASDDPARLALPRADVAARLQEAGLAADPYFDAAVCEAMFTLPPLVRQALGRA